MKSKLLLATVPVALCALLAGCGDTTPISRLKVQYMTTNAAPVMQTDTKAQAQLANASVSVDQSSAQDAAISLATHPAAKVAPQLDPGAIHMTQITSLNWYGPLQPLLAKIASASNYKFRVLGNKPALAIIIAIDTKNQPLAYILQNAIYQAAGKATVKIYPGRRILELRYPA